MIAVTRPDLSQRLPFATLCWAGSMALVLGCGFMTNANAQSQPPSSSNKSAFYCVDASGRKLTSDRLIAACMDREQRQILSNGTVRIIPPRATMQEQAQREEQQRLARIQRQEEARQRAALRALHARYPNRAALEAARAEALKVPQVQIESAQDKLKSLAQTRKKLDLELEFYANNPDQIPPVLRRQSDSYEAAVKAQNLEIANYQAEATRINQRFDQDAKRLEHMWQPSNEPMPR